MVWPDETRCSNEFLIVSVQLIKVPFKGLFGITSLQVTFPEKVNFPSRGGVNGVLTISPLIYHH